MRSCGLRYQSAGQVGGEAPGVIRRGARGGEAILEMGQENELGGRRAPAVRGGEDSLDPGGRW